MIVLDSSVLIAAERGELHLDVVLPKPDEEQVSIAAITASELLHGVHRAKGVRQRSRREAFVEHLLSLLPVIPFDLTVARIHARLWARLAARGVQIGAHDLQIAATTLVWDGRVATRDARSFPRITGLKVVRW